MKRSLTTLTQGAKWLGVVALSAALVAGCSAKPAAAPEAQAAAAQQQVKTVKTAKVEKQKIGDPLEQVGDVVSSVRLDVVAKAGGEIVEVLKKRGDAVQKGDVLFRLDPVDVELQKEQSDLSIRSAEAQLKKAREDVDNGKTELKNAIVKLETAVSDLEKAYNRTHNDYDAGNATQAQLDQARTQLSNMQLDLDIQRKKLQTLENTDSLATVEMQLESAKLGSRSAVRALSNLEVKAPASGVLTDLTAEVGMTITPGFRAGEVQQLNPVKIKSTLTETAAALVRGKSSLVFYIPDVTDKQEAKVTFLSDVMNSQTKAYDLELEVANADGKLKPGAKAQIVLTSDSEQIVPVVPTLSVVREGSDSFVFVLKGNTVEKRKVELGRLNEANQEVLSGVVADETIVVSGQHQLKDQDQVQAAN
ncbi:efflux RND transporter periplasmic adaptor subunit [Paenibacillus athensensis]|uniref:Efflux transporter periplasmic adaptor subunit n=1 Tax=Paenibacillus athensensis TaxID=1967502 RepID=A0A4Y8PQY1_9BACL|nr:efflux RND transporter periplasmic adaptor subunit [Paenibacillus athensensis]MCD1261661.1 efflux RND transporter periplasmic adaptor subunit [Paenibacillus athensensis]